MKLERLPEYLISIVVTILGLAFALYAGNLIGSGNTRNLMLIAGGVGFVAIGLLFKERVWVLIYICWACTGRMFSTPATPHDAAVFVAFSWFLIFKAFKLIKNKPVYTFVDVLVLINVLYVGTMYIRNPVGGLAIDSDLIGGRPYFDLVIAVCAYWVLVRADISASLAHRLPYLSLLGQMPSFLFSLASVLYPPATMPLARIYSGIATSGDDADFSSGRARLAFLGGPGRWIFSYLVCVCRPITLINPLYFGRFLLISLAFTAVLLSGFRSNIIIMGVSFVLCCCYRKKVSDLIKIGVLAAPILAVLLSMQGVFFSLPFAVQRSLSFLPAKWDEAALSDAESSAEWRFEMWRWMWNEEKYLKNWWFGDGFGYSQEVLSQNLAAAARGDYKATQEGFLITGRVHSGPLSSIRFAGIVGLVLYLLLAFYAMRMAHRLIIRTQGTPFGLPALFTGVSIVYTPFFFLFVYGAYENNLPQTIFGVGVMKLLARGFDRYRAGLETNKEETPKELPQLLDTRPAMLNR